MKKLIYGCVFIMSLLSYAQEKKLYNIDTIHLKVTKLNVSWLKSVNSVQELDTKNKEQLPQNSLQEFLVKSPSVFSLNTNNKAQDLRVSIRGFGTRSNFGIRGIKVIVDGIPETTTDGQTQLDNLNLGIIEKIEVLNSGASSLYGNASGGVLNIETIDESIFKKKKHILNIGLGRASYNGKQYDFTMGSKIDNKLAYIFHSSHKKSEGYREHSNYESTNLNLRLIYRMLREGKLEATVNYLNSPVANDPGGVDLSSVIKNQRKANTRNLILKTGEKINQFKASIRYNTKIWKSSKFNIYNFYSKRGFEGRIPIPSNGIILLERNYYGHGSSLTSTIDFKKIKYTNSVGYEFSFQDDKRKRFENNEGVKGSKVLDQDEVFLNLGAYWIHDIDINKLKFTTSVRYDKNKIKLKDKFLINGNDSNKIDFNNLSYGFGFLYNYVERQSVFANFSTSYETPTLNELSNNQNGVELGKELKAQTAYHIDIGVKGNILGKSKFQTSVFYIKSRNEILKVEKENAIFFSNIGETKKMGVELFLEHTFNKAYKVFTSCSYNNFVFTDYIVSGQNLKNNKLPGVPVFRCNTQVDVLVKKNILVNFQYEARSKIFTDNLNSEATDFTNILNASLKYNLNLKGVEASFYVGANNILKSNYIDNIRINAFGKRYYEAAPDKFYYAGIRFKL